VDRNTRTESGLPDALGAAGKSDDFTEGKSSEQRLNIAVATFNTITTFCRPAMGTWVPCRYDSRNGVLIDHLIDCITKQDDILVEGFNLAL
jgi:hypothetical protein